MNRLKHTDPKYTLVTWTESDIPEKIIDCSFSGKLMPKVEIKKSGIFI